MRGLHPIEDGLVDNTPNTRIRTHDSGGNRLVDINSQLTGFCTGVRSPLMGGTGTRTTVSGQANRTDRDYQPVGEHPGRYADMSGLISNDPSTGRVAPVVRLTTDGDTPLPVARVAVDKAAIAARAEEVRKKREKEGWVVITVLRKMGWEGELSDIPEQLYNSTLQMVKAQRRNRRNEALKSQ